MLKHQVLAAAGISTTRPQRTREPRRASRGAALIATMAALVAGLLLATASPAVAISGLDRYDGYSGYDDRPWKRAIATCPDGKHVIGGGAWVSDGGRKTVRLTTLLPYSPAGARDTFNVDAEAPNLQRFNWSVTAYAMCADKTALSNYRIVPGFVESSKTFQTAAARCPDGTVAFGAGAQVTAQPPYTAPGQGQIGLQLNRTSGPLDISRAAARESVAGYAGQWRLISYAVCAEPRGTIHAEGTVNAGAEATDTCKTGFTHGPGGGGGLTDGGPAWLQRIYPRLDKRTVDVALTAPLYPSIGGMVAHQTCAL